MNQFIFLLFLLLLTAAASHAAVPAQVYWKSVLPNTPMPSAIRELIPTATDELTDEKTGTSVNVGKGGVSVNTGKGSAVNVGRKGVGVNVGSHGSASGGTRVGVGSGGVHVSNGKGKTNVNVRKGGVGVSVGGGRGGTRVGVGKGGVGVTTGGRKGKPPVIVKVGDPFKYVYAASETQLHDDPNAALFLLENDLHPGAKMNLYFGKSTSGAAFISRSAADSMPFSSAELPQILNHFSINPNSAEAEITKNTLKECEEPGVEGESKHCVTSLESMVEFSMSSLKTSDIQASSTTVEDVPLQLYTVEQSGARAMAGSKLVACHPEAYAYAVFYCHATGAARAYTVPLAGADGTKVEAVAVCHTDTASWNPKHLAFQVLKVKPGSVPVCHFLPHGHVVWTSRS